MKRINLNGKMCTANSDRRMRQTVEWFCWEMWAGKTLNAFSLNANVLRFYRTTITDYILVFCIASLHSVIHWQTHTLKSVHCAPKYPLLFCVDYTKLSPNYNCMCVMWAVSGHCWTARRVFVSLHTMHSMIVAMENSVGWSPWAMSTECVKSILNHTVKPIVLQRDSQACKDWIKYFKLFRHARFYSCCCCWNVHFLIGLRCDEFHFVPDCWWKNWSICPELMQFMLRLENKFKLQCVYLHLSHLFYSHSVFI